MVGLLAMLLSGCCDWGKDADRYGARRKWDRRSAASGVAARRPTLDGAAQGGRRRGRTRRVLPIDEACVLYNISIDEFLAWERDLDGYGVHGLRTTRYQIYRSTEKQSG